MHIKVSFSILHNASFSLESKRCTTFSYVSLSVKELCVFYEACLPGEKYSKEEKKINAPTAPNEREKVQQLI